MVMENKKQLLLDAYQFRHAVRQFDSEKKSMRTILTQF